jgi:ParB family transcriptional regulator, chromosome partitioning protein
VTSGAPPPARRRGLGRGLDALLSTPSHPLPLDTPPPAVDDDEPRLAQVEVSAVSPNPEQPRRDFAPEGLRDLAESIRTHGLLQPIVVERDAGRLRLVAGERRLRAALLAGLTHVPALIRPATQSGREALELALVENLQRTDLSPLEEAAAYARLADAFGLSHEAIALRVSRSRAAVTNTLRLLSLPAPVQTALREGRITAGHARALLGAPSDSDREELAEAVALHGLSVRQVEHEVGRRAAIRASAPSGGTAETQPPARARSSSRLGPDDSLLERSLEEALGTQVRLHRRRRGGQVVIDFHDDEQLHALYTSLGGPPL